MSGIYRTLSHGKWYGDRQGTVSYGYGELISQLNKQSERVIFLGDGVPVYQGMIREKMTVPYAFAPAQMNRQRASCVAALGMKALNEATPE